MVGTITFGGIGSGMDTESIVSALVGVERTAQNALRTRQTATESSLSNLSSISSLLSKLKSASDALDTATEVGSFKVTSSSTSLVASANGLAQPGSYAVEVTQLAKEQRTYSNTFSSASTALNQSGTLAIGVGSGTPVNIAITASDTLDNVISKINSAGLRVSASAFYDGTNYRIQLRGLDTGAESALSISETGVSLGFTVPANTYQAAQNATLKIDGFQVTSATNQVTGAIRGVTLALTAPTTGAATVSIDNDPQGLQTKLRTMVDAYNAVVSKVQETVGGGGLKAKDPELAGDSTLRSLTSRISSTLLTPIAGGDRYNTLASIGLSLDRAGKLSLDGTKLEQALAADSAAVSKVLAGTDAAQGVMDTLSSAVDAFTKSGTGLLVTRTETLNKRVSSLKAQIEREDTRINRYADQLRKQFTQMDTMVSAWNAQGSYLNRL
jgi:flagellar hook-associated protein 2